ncbi:MAG: threonylcarbamoyl-AMP synthase [Lachnospiraceae bacterium]|nr:threonylcarbamoyl-AMP synthase [Lachnospiraceae bacterium]
MQTLVVTQDENRIEKQTIIQAGEIIRNGGLVAFPTETVYGLGGDGLNPDSSRKIYAAKGRPSDNPLIIHIYRMEDLQVLVKEIPDNAKKLAEAFWPGPLTMILPKADIVPKETTGGLDTVAVRMPSHKIALAFIEAAGGFVAAPSANLSGKPSPTLAKYVVEDMDGRIDMIIDGGDIAIGLESTIVDLTGDVPMILRPGYITLDMLKDVLGEVECDPTLLDGDCKERPKAPGMRYRHYAPKGDMLIVDGETEAVVREINRCVADSRKQGFKTGVIATGENADKYEADVVKVVGGRNEETAIAASLYRILREFDDEEVDAIYSESFATDGIGQAIMNRLLKAAGHKYIQIREEE